MASEEDQKNTEYTAFQLAYQKTYAKPTLETLLNIFQISINGSFPPPTSPMPETITVNSKGLETFKLKHILESISRFGLSFQTELWTGISVILKVEGMSLEMCLVPNDNGTQYSWIVDGDKKPSYEEIFKEKFNDKITPERANGMLLQLRKKGAFNPSEETSPSNWKLFVLTHVLEDFRRISVSHAAVPILDPLELRDVSIKVLETFGLTAAHTGNKSRTPGSAKLFRAWLTAVGKNKVDGNFKSFHDYCTFAPVGGTSLMKLSALLGYNIIRNTKFESLESQLYEDFSDNSDSEVQESINGIYSSMKNIELQE